MQGGCDELSGRMVFVDVRTRFRLLTACRLQQTPVRKSLTRTMRTFQMHMLGGFTSFQLVFSHAVNMQRVLKAYLPRLQFDGPAQIGNTMTQARLSPDPKGQHSHYLQ